MPLILPSSGFHKALLSCLTIAIAAGPLQRAWSQAAMPADEQAKIAAVVQDVLRKTDTPSAQIGIVEHGQVVYTAAFGEAQLQPKVPATTAMAYGVGSVSKQFTAVAVMVLVEQGKLKLDDPVSEWFPEFAHSKEITLRNLLNQVSGYSDYYTEDYLTLELAHPTATYEMVKRWTSKSLDFAPGIKWQYSNTNYTLAALIVQKAAKQPFFDFLQKNVLQPAGLQHVVDLDSDNVPAVPKGYIHFAFGPSRETPREARGTLSGAGQLAMPIGELMLWDTVVMHRQKIIKPASWQVLQAEVNLPDGSGTGYGMGFFVGAHNSHRIIQHSGEINGFTTLNQLYPENGTAIGALINGNTATGEIVGAIENVIFAPKKAEGMKPYPKEEALLKSALEQLQKGSIDRSILAPNLDFYFTPQAIADYRTSLVDFGTITKIEIVRAFERGGMKGYSIRVTGSSAETIDVLMYITADGKLDQIQLSRR